VNAVLGIAARELGAVWRTPVGWISAALYAFLTGFVFVETTLVPGEAATLRYFFSPSGWLLVAVAPALSMRLFSNESPLGSIELLRAAPISAGALVIGKILGACLSLPLLLSPTLAFPVVLAFTASPTPDPGPIAAGYAGLLLVGFAYVSIGALASAIADSPTLAFLGALIAILTLQIGAVLLPQRLPAELAGPIAAVSVQPRIGDFARGVIDTRHVVTLCVVTVWLVSMTTAVLVLKRPR